MGLGAVSLLAARLARLPLWARAENWLRNLPPWGALLAFFLPVLLLLPVKVLALYLFGHGHSATAVSLLVVAKLVGTAIVARIFQLVEAALMAIPLFARWYPRWKVEHHVLTLVRAWRVVRAFNWRAHRFWRWVRGEAP